MTSKNDKITKIDQRSQHTECSISVPYLLALNAGLLQSKDGRYWADRSWHKDLMRHTQYISNLTFLAPISKGVPPADFVNIPTNKIRIVGYYNNGGMIQSYLKIPLIVIKLFKEIRKTKIVHTCIAGYPFPLGWIAIPIARLLNRKIVLTVESSFWRIPAGEKASIFKKIKSSFWEYMNRYCLRQADYAAYPHEQYRKSLPSPRAGGGVLFQASWIEASQIVSQDEVENMWNIRSASGRTPKFLFAARMVQEKGTRILYDAVRYIESKNLDINFDFIGIGPEIELFKKLLSSEWGKIHVNILNPIPYGHDFFVFLRDYDAVLSPGLSDEQPRIVYDAYAGGVPSIASNMPGLAACVKDGITGKLIPTGDVNALANAIIFASKNPAVLASWGKAGRNAATKFTHDQMHIDRCIDIQKII